ncbi:MAG: lipid-A-disaccharide synthase [Terricaulis sp.]
MADLNAATTTGATKRPILIVAAEASGDTLGAALMRRLREQASHDLRFVGIGGTQMRSEGLDSIVPMESLAVMGVFDALRAYPHVRRAVVAVTELAVRENPSAAVLIDSWGLTIRIADFLRVHQPDLPLIKYVGPQVWAHRAGRAGKIAERFDVLLSTNLLDLPYYKGLKLRVDFVGNPALNSDLSQASADRCRARICAEQSQPILLLAPGSRAGEIDRMSGPLGEATALLSARAPRLIPVVLAAAPVAARVRAAVAAWPVTARIVESEEDKADAMIAATAAIACSGTVATELALANCPMAVGYRIGPLTYAVLKPMFKLKYFTLFNIAADKEVAPEFLQTGCTGAALAGAVLPFLEQPLVRAKQIQAQADALTKLGPRGVDPAEAAARAVLETIATRP